MNAQKNPIGPLVLTYCPHDERVKNATNIQLIMEFIKHKTLSTQQGYATYSEIIEFAFKIIEYKKSLFIQGYTRRPFDKITERGFYSSAMSTVRSHCKMKLIKENGKREGFTYTGDINKKFYSRK